MEVTMRNNVLPVNIITAVKNEAVGLEHGSIRLMIYIRDGKP
jgi:hypothetical protein